VAIGGTETDILANTDAAILEYAKKQSPFGRLATIHDLGDAVALLVSESARWISGQSVVVSGAAH
jgi:3-oxoacyl-[acyl-carrier protein] reductase